MKKYIVQLFTTIALFSHICLGLAAVNPITITYSNGTTSFSKTTSGNANYVVAVNSGVIPTNVPLTLHLTSTGGGANLIATQQLGISSPCPNVNTLCSSMFSLRSGQSCCLALTLTSPQAGSYFLQPTVSTTPATYSTQAPSAQPVTVSQLPNLLTATVVSSSLNPSVTSMPVTLTANISASGSVPVGGSVAFFANGTPIAGCNAASLTAGLARCTTSSLTTGTYTITAAYSGALGFTDSTTLASFTQYVDSTVQDPLTVPSAPLDVVAMPENSAASISWTPPANTGGTTISGYTVTYGVTSSGSYSTTGCSTSSATNCTVTLPSSGSYTFVVTASNSVGTGPAGYSSPITPEAVIAASPSNLALAVSGTTRSIAFTNTSNSALTISSVIAAGLPANTTLTNASCIGSIAANSSCTVTVTPGDTVSLDTTSQLCSNTTGAPTAASTVTLITNGGSAVANIYVLNYGCTYQGGYLFSIDDTTPSTTCSIGGKVVEPEAQILAQATDAVQWSPDTTSIWGIDETSTIPHPSPNNMTPIGYTATLVTGQTNCSGATDGSCNTHNIYIYYNAHSISTANYAAGICVVDTTGNYNDWYLPSICEMGSESTSETCSISAEQNMADSLPSLLQNPSGVCSLLLCSTYWSATEEGYMQAQEDPQDDAWRENFSSPNSSASAVPKTLSNPGTLCARLLTP